MGDSNTAEYNKEVCEMRHEAQQRDIAALHEVNKELWKAVEEITQPSAGHLAALRAELEHKIESLESKYNGLIILIMTTAVGTAIAIGKEFLQKFLK